MANEPVIGLDLESFRTLQEIVAWWESSPFRKQTVAAVRRSPETVIQHSSATDNVRCSSTTTTGGFYPGKVQTFNGSTSTYTDVGDCWLQDRGGATLTLRKFEGRRSGVYSNKPVYLVDSPALTVQEQDLSPTINGVTKIEFLELHGYQVTEVSAGFARLGFLAAGSTGEIQFNNSSLTASSTFTYTVSTRTLLQTSAAIGTPGKHKFTQSDTLTAGGPNYLGQFEYVGNDFIAGNNLTYAKLNALAVYNGASDPMDGAFDFYTYSGDDSVSTLTVRLIGGEVVLYNRVYVGTSSTDVVSMYGGTGSAQGSAIADASGGATVDSEARTAINDLLAFLRTRGDIAT